MTSEQERISTLEAQRKSDAKRVEGLEQTVQRIDKNVQDIQSQLSRQKGFVAGVLFILTPIWGAILVTGKHWWDKLFT